jgi:hypothetical protein
MEAQMGKVIYEEQTGTHIPPSMVIHQSDDAWHPLKDRYYVEWWYFDLFARDGSLVRGQLFIAGDASRPKRVTTGVRASYVKTDGTEIRIELRLPFSSFKASTEVCDVQIGRNFIRGNLSHYEVHIEDEENVLDLQLDSGIKGVTSHACFGDESRYMYWVVPQPRCQAKGTFSTRGQTHAIEGVGYRDHNWSNIAFLDLLSYWDWGVIYDSAFTIIFADILTTKRMGDAEIKPILVYDSEKLIYLTTARDKWGLGKADIRPDPVTGVEIPHRDTLWIRDEGLSLEVELKLQRVFQRIDLLADFNPLLRFAIRTFKAKPTITSLFSVGSGKLSYSGEQKTMSCSAVHELVKNH